MNENLADAFGSEKQQDAYFEGLLKLKEENPEKFNQISNSQRMALGYYIEKKEKQEKNNEK